MTTPKFHKINHDLKTVLWCGPAALAILTGKPTSIIREVLRGVLGRETIQGVSCSALRTAAGRMGYDLRWREPQGRKTIRQWVKANREGLRDGYYILVAGHHYISLTGQMFCDNWTKTPVRLNKAPGLRRIVTDAWRVEKSDVNLLPLPKAPAPKTDADRKIREEAKRIAKQAGCFLERYENAAPGAVEYWVHPPTGLEVEELDPFCGDHLAFDWLDIRDRAQKYLDAVTALSKSSATNYEHRITRTAQETASGETNGGLHSNLSPELHVDCGPVARMDCGELGDGRSAEVVAVVPGGGPAGELGVRGELATA